MTPESFHDALCNFGDHPDRIAELRKVAVGLAILAHWKVGAEMRCAAELAGAIAAEKASLVDAGAISKPKPHLPVRPDDLPDVFKNSATFVPLGQIARIEKGQTGIKQAVPGDYPLVVTAATRSSCDHFDFEGAAAVIPLVSATGHGNASINRLHYQEGKFALGTILAAVFPYAPEIISARFLFEYLSAFKDELLVSRMTGTANVTLTIGRIAEVPVPLISPEVQGQLDTFMALCDQLEAARAEREAGRDRLTAATLARINAPDPKTFPADARFALDNITPLTTRPDQIKQLRQTILNLAVRGKLVKQNAADEPATELLKRIAAERMDLIRRKVIKKSDLPEIATGEKPYPLPSNWQWSLLGNIGDWGAGSTPSRSNTELYGGNVTWLKSGELNDNRALVGSEETVTEAAVHSGSFRLNQPGDVLIAMYGATIGKLAILAEPAVTNQAVCGCTPFTGISNQYLFLFLLSQRAQFHGASEGGAQPNISKIKIVNTLVPVPPHAEQRRIVVKVDELMDLCDQIEASLIEDEETRSRLLNSVLLNALEPA